MKLVDTLRALEPRFIALRRDIHAHPELAFEERRTADLVARTLQAAGIEVHTGLAGTGWSGCSETGQAPAPSACAPTWTRCPSRNRTVSPITPAILAACMPAATTGTPPCCSLRPSISPPRATSTGPSISFSSRPRRPWARRG